MTQCLTTKITKKCIQLYDGGEIWVENKVADTIAQNLDQKEKIVKLGGQIFRMSQICGIKSEEYMREQQLKKQGYWKCDYGVWHAPKEKCYCGMTYKAQAKEEEPKEQVQTGKRLQGLTKWGVANVPDKIKAKYNN